jgi:predicted XRE-type DNA-binding protein
MRSESTGDKMSKSRFPSEAEIREMRDLLSKGPASRPLPKNASQIDKVKYQICKEFVVYKNSRKITQKALAEKIDIDESLISKILHYNIDEFTIDRLIKFLTTLHPGVNLQIKVA